MDSLVAENLRLEDKLAELLESNVKQESNDNKENLKHISKEIIKDEKVTCPTVGRPKLNTKKIAQKPFMKKSQLKKLDSSIKLIAQRYITTDYCTVNLLNSLLGGNTNIIT